MKKCCYLPVNLFTYGTKKKTEQAHRGLLTIRYITYMRCKVCETPLQGEVVKTVHDRKPVKA